MAHQANIQKIIQRNMKNIIVTFCISLISLLNTSCITTECVPIQHQFAYRAQPQVISIHSKPRFIYKNNYYDGYTYQIYQFRKRTNKYRKHHFR